LGPERPAEAVVPQHFSCRGLDGAGVQAAGTDGGENAPPHRWGPDNKTSPEPLPPAPDFRFILQFMVRLCPPVLMGARVQLTRTDAVTRHLTVGALLHLPECCRPSTSDCRPA